MVNIRLVFIFEHLFFRQFFYSRFSLFETFAILLRNAIQTRLGVNLFFFRPILVRQAQPEKNRNKCGLPEGKQSIWALAECEWRTAAPLASCSSACRVPQVDGLARIK